MTTRPEVSTPPRRRFPTLRLTPGFVAVAIVTLVYLARYVLFDGPRTGGDGHYSWIFARSLAFDHDLDLRNDYALCGDPWHVGHDEGGHHPANPFYLGPALLWAPVLAIVKLLVPLGAHPHPSWAHGCAGPWMVGTFAITPFIGGLTLWLGYRAAKRFTREGPAIAAMAVVGLCSPLLHFASLTVSYSHTWAALGVAVALITWLRATEEPASLRRWLIAGLGVGFAALMRSQAAVLLLAPALTLFDRIVRDARARKFSRTNIVAGLVTVAGFLAVFSIQLAAYRYLYGRFWVVPQGRAYLQLAHAHPFLTLFAARSGLLYWHPVMWIGVVGFAMFCARRETRSLGLALLVPTLIDVYVSSAVLDWHGGASFGARRLTTLAAPFALTSAVCLATTWQWLSRSRMRLAAFAATGWLLPWVIINIGASSGNVDNRVSYQAAVPMPELYSTGLRIGLDGVYHAVGNPFVLPASLAFAARYRVHPRYFDVAATGGYFNHDYRPVRLAGQDTIVLGAENNAQLVIDGFTREGDALHLRGGTPGRMFAELAWPYVTHVRIVGHAVGSAPVPVTITRGGSLTHTRVGVATFGATSEGIELAVPRGTFDSGINEIVFEAPRDVVLERWTWIDRDVHDSSIR